MAVGLPADLAEFRKSFKVKTRYIINTLYLIRNLMHMLISNVSAEESIFFFNGDMLSPWQTEAFIYVSMGKP